MGIEGRRVNAGKAVSRIGGLFGSSDEPNKRRIRHNELASSLRTIIEYCQTILARMARYRPTWLFISTMTNSSAPLLIILPGLDGSGRLSVPFMHALEAQGVESQVIAYPKDRAMGYDALRDWLRPQLLRQPPFVLLGESFAGPLAIMLGTTGLTSLRGIILSTTFARAPVPAPSVLARVLQLPLPLPPVAPLARLLLGRWRTPSLEGALRDALAGTSPSVLRARAVETLRIDVRALLPLVSTPVLCLHANEDRLLQASALRSIEHGLQQPAESHLLDGPHLLLQAQPVEAAARVASWLRTLDRGTLPHAPPEA